MDRNRNGWIKEDVKIDLSNQKKVETKNSYLMESQDNFFMEEPPIKKAKNHEFVKFIGSRAKGLSELNIKETPGKMLLLKGDYLNKENSNSENIEPTSKAQRLNSKKSIERNHSSPRIAKTGSHHF